MAKHIDAQFTSLVLVSFLLKRGKAVFVRQIGQHLTADLLAIPAYSGTGAAAWMHLKKLLAFLGADAGCRDRRFQLSP
jgi:ribosomal protein S5